MVTIYYYDVTTFSVYVTFIDFSQQLIDLKYLVAHCHYQRSAWAERPVGQAGLGLLVLSSEWAGLVPMFDGPGSKLQPIQTVIVLIYAISLKK